MDSVTGPQDSKWVCIERRVGTGPRTFVFQRRHPDAEDPPRDRDVAVFEPTPIHELAELLREQGWIVKSSSADEVIVEEKK